MSTSVGNDKNGSKLSITTTSSDMLQLAPVTFVLLVEHIVHGKTGTHVDAVAKDVIHV